MKKIYSANVFVILFVITMMISCASCERNEAPNKVLITCILTPDYFSDLGYPVGIEKNEYRVTAVIAYYRKAFIKDAEVVLRTDSQEVYLTPVEIFDDNQASNSTYYIDTAKSLKVIPGETYFLDVRLKDGRIFNSQTKIPEAPIIHYPITNSTLDIDTRNEFGKTIGYFPFEYSKDYSCYVTFMSQVDSLGISSWSYSISPYDTLGVIFSGDSLIKRTIHLCTLDSAFSKQAWRLTKFSFTADSEYADLYQKYSALEPIEASSNINGKNGIGVFGSYNHTRVQFFLRKK